jgi:hypothetical protein
MIPLPWVTCSRSRYTHSRSLPLMQILFVFVLNIFPKRVRGSTTIDRNCDLSNSQYKQATAEKLAEACGEELPLSAIKKDEWIRRVNNWLNNPFFRNILKPALLRLRQEGIMFDEAYPEIIAGNFDYSNSL